MSPVCGIFFNDIEYEAANLPLNWLVVVRKVSTPDVDNLKKVIELNFAKGNPFIRNF